MKAAAAALTIVLGACTAAPPPGDIRFRNPTAPLGGTTRFDAARFAGEWHVVARFGEVGATLRRYTHDPVTNTLVTEGDGTPRIYRVTGPGILREDLPEGGETLVVMWVDEGFRTAALGTASGSRGEILDRKPRVAEDRYAAATKILTFYGWDTARLKRVAR